jgi:uncharacterized protein YxeA
MPKKQTVVITAVAILAVILAIGIRNFIRMRSETAANPYLKELRVTDTVTQQLDNATNSLIANTNSTSQKP